MATLTDVETGVRGALDRFARAYEAKDADKVMKVFAPGADTSGVGTGADEIRIGAHQIRTQVDRDFAQADRISMSLGTPHISGAGDVGWVLVPCRIEVSAGGQRTGLDTRLTAVVARSGDEWLIHQFHLSAPMADQQEGQSYPTR